VIPLITVPTEIVVPRSLPVPLPVVIVTESNEFAVVPEFLAVHAKTATTL